MSDTFDVDIRSRADGRVPGEVFRPGWLGNPTVSEDGCLICGSVHEGYEGLGCYEVYLERRWSEYSFRAALSGIVRGSATIGPSDELHFEALTRFVEERLSSETDEEPPLEDSAIEGPTIELCRTWDTIWKQDDDQRLVLLPAGRWRDGTIRLLGPAGEAAEDAFPGLTEKMSASVDRAADEDGWCGVMISPRWPKSYFGLIQVATRSPSSNASKPRSARLHLIRRAIGRLTRWIYGDDLQRERERKTKYFEGETRRTRLSTSPRRARIDIPIGPRSHGGLELHDLWKAYDTLPRTVHLWVEPEGLRQNRDG